jgi:hypothetical protein
VYDTVYYKQNYVLLMVDENHIYEYLLVMMTGFLFGHHKD